MSKINELFEDDKTIYCFDLDGVLASLEYGDYNHYMLDDEEWSKATLKKDFYESKKPIKVFQKFINDRDITRIYVISKVLNDFEGIHKANFLNNNYGILKEHIYTVYNNEEKLEKMNLIKSKYEDIDDKFIVMIDDTVEVLNHIMNNSGYSTIHVSSFFDR